MLMPSAVGAVSLGGIKNITLYPGQSVSVAELGNGWRTSNPKIVSVTDTGFITAVAAGNCRIFNKYSKITVKVVNFPKPDKLELTEMQTDEFSALLPEDFLAYSQYGRNFVAFCEKQPGKMIFCIGKSPPFYTREVHRIFDKNAIDSGNLYIPWIDAPVVEGASAAKFFESYNALVGEKAALLKYYFPILEQFSVVSQEQVFGIYDNMSSGVVVGTFVYKGVAYAGIFCTSIQRTKAEHGLAVAFTTLGVAAPAGEFERDANELLASASSVIVKSGNFSGEKLTLAIQKMREVMESATPEQGMEIKLWGEAQRGTTRIYDLQTGAVYRVKSDFYNTYKNNNFGSEMKYLVKLPEIPELWALPVKPASDIS